MRRKERKEEKGRKLAKGERKGKGGQSEKKIILNERRRIQQVLNTETIKDF